MVEEFQFLSSGTPHQKYIGYEVIISSSSSQRTLSWGRKRSLQNQKQFDAIWTEGIASIVGMYEKLTVQGKNCSSNQLYFWSRPTVFFFSFSHVLVIVPKTLCY